MNDGGQNDEMNDSREQLALTLTAIVTVTVSGFALKLFQQETGADFDIWRIVQVFCVVSISTFGASYLFFRYFLKQRKNRDSVMRHFILSVLSYPFKLSPFVKGIIVFSLAGTGIILYLFFSHGTVWFGEMYLCMLFGIPLVAFLNNTLGERRNERVAITIYLTIFFLIITVVCFGPLIIINGKFSSFSWFWFLAAVLLIAVFIHGFYPGLFALTEEERKDTLERYFSLGIPYDQAFDHCQAALQGVFLGRITSSNLQTGMIGLKTPLSRYKITIIRSYAQQSRVRIQREDAGRIYRAGLWKKWHIRNLDRICESIME